MGSTGTTRNGSPNPSFRLARLVAEIGSAERDSGGGSEVEVEDEDERD